MSRPGDWVCPECNNHNYASRDFCNIAHCGTSRPSNASSPEDVKAVTQSQGQRGTSVFHRGDPNNWFCPACKNENFPGRQHCNKKDCNYARPQDQTKNWICPNCGNDNYGYRKSCNNKACGTQRPGTSSDQFNFPYQGGFEPAPVQFSKTRLPSNARPGDWICPVCNNHNYASRDTCNAPGCTQSKVNYELAPHEAAQMRLQSTILTPFDTMGLPQKPLVNARPGDWICPACNNHNYASREACNGPGCTQPKVSYEMMPQDIGQMQLAHHVAQIAPMFQQAMPPSPRARPGDWICPMCANHNYASRENCNFSGCNQPKPLPYEQIHHSPPVDPRYGNHGSPPNIPHSRPGDWFCKKCLNHNYASRDTCNGPNCNQARAVNDVVMEEICRKRSKPGDPHNWICDECGNENFPNRLYCNVKSCNRPRENESKRIKQEMGAMYKKNDY